MYVCVCVCVHIINNTIETQILSLYQENGHSGAIQITVWGAQE